MSRTMEGPVYVIHTLKLISHASWASGQYQTQSLRQLYHLHTLIYTYIYIMSSNAATWSMCACVSATASTFDMPHSMHASRSSGGVSTRSAAPSDAVTYAPQRRRRSRGSGDVHTRHVQPICGTPTEVPVPRKRNVKPVPVTRYFFSGIFPVVKYCSTSSRVRPFVSGRKNAAVMK